MQRRENWHVDLAAFLQERRDRPFEWGKHDCCLFVCDAIQAHTGLDLGEAFRGKYTDAISAARVMKAYAGAGVAAVAEKIAADHHIPEIPPFFAQRGDVALFAGEHGEMLGIVDLNGRHIVSTGENGLERVPLEQAMRAWHL
jgi:hypothetical protein